MNEIFTPEFIRWLHQYWKENPHFIETMEREIRQEQYTLYFGIDRIAQAFDAGRSCGRNEG